MLLLGRASVAVATVARPPVHLSSHDPRGGGALSCDAGALLSHAAVITVTRRKDQPLIFIRITESASSPRRHTETQPGMSSGSVQSHFGEADCVCAAAVAAF